MIILHVLENNQYQAYKKLLYLILESADSFELVVREDLGFTKIDEKITDALASYLIHSKREKEWAAQITNSVHTINRYKFNSETLSVLLKFSNFFSDFGDEYSLEDLSFFILDKPYFVSVGHEHEQYFLLKSEYDVMYIQKKMDSLKILYDPTLEESI